MAAYDPTKDPRLDPRVVPFLQLMAGMGGNLGGDISDRDSYVAEANTPEALAASEAGARLSSARALPARRSVSTRLGLPIPEISIGAIICSTVPGARRWFFSPPLAAGWRKTLGFY